MNKEILSADIFIFDTSFEVVPFKCENLKISLTFRQKKKFSNKIQMNRHYCHVYLLISYKMLNNTKES